MSSNHHVSMTVQAILLSTAVMIISITQGIALYKLYKVENPNETVNHSKRLLLYSIIIQVIITLLLIMSLVFTYKKDGSHYIVYTCLIASGSLLIIASSISANVALTLQCSRDGNADINTAWNVTTWASVAGFFGTLLALMTQLFVRRTEIKTILVKKLNNIQSQPVDNRLRNNGRNRHNGRNGY